MQKCRISFLALLLSTHLTILGCKLMKLMISVTRYGDFISSLLVPKHLTKLAQTFGDFWSYFENFHVFSKHPCDCMLGNIWTDWANIQTNIWSHLLGRSMSVWNEACCVFKFSFFLLCIGRKKCRKGRYEGSKRHLVSLHYLCLKMQRHCFISVTGSHSDTFFEA